MYLLISPKNKLAITADPPNAILTRYISLNAATYESLVASEAATNRAGAYCPSAVLFLVKYAAKKAEIWSIGKPTAAPTFPERTSFNLFCNTLKYIAYPILPPKSRTERVNAVTVAISSSGEIKVRIVTGGWMIPPTPRPPRKLSPVPRRECFV